MSRHCVLMLVHCAPHAQSGGSPESPFLHSPENNHVASVPSHSNTRPAHPKAAIRMPSSAGPTHPMVSVPSSMIASRLLAPLRVGEATLRDARSVGLGGTQRVALMWAWNGILCSGEHFAWIKWQGGAMGKLAERTPFCRLTHTGPHASQRWSAHWRRLEEFLLQPEIDQRFNADAALMRLLFNGR